MAWVKDRTACSLQPTASSLQPGSATLHPVARCPMHRHRNSSIALPCPSPRCACRLPPAADPGQRAARHPPPPAGCAGPHPRLLSWRLLRACQGRRPRHPAGLTPLWGQQGLQGMQGLQMQRQRYSISGTAAHHRAGAAAGCCIRSVQWTCCHNKMRCKPVEPPAKLCSSSCRLLPSGVAQPQATSRTPLPVL